MSRAIIVTAAAGACVCAGVAARSAPAPAQAPATIALAACVDQQFDTVTVSGSGYAPESKLLIVVAPTSRGSVMGGSNPVEVRPDGSFKVKVNLFNAGRLPLDVRPRKFTLTAYPQSDGDGTNPALATTTFWATQFQAYARTEGNSIDARVRWRIDGFPTGAPVWIHYRYRGREARREKVGTAKGPCGSVRFTQRVLPRKIAKRGAWVVKITPDRIFDPHRRQPVVTRKLSVESLKRHHRVYLSTTEADLRYRDRWRE